MTTLTYQPEPLDAESTAVAEHAMRVSDLFVDLTRGLSPGTIVRRDEPMARRTTLRVGGPVDLYVEPQTESDLSLVLEYCKGQSMPWFVLGRGSNLLVRDGGVRGLAISLAQPVFSQVNVQNQQLICGAGARLKTISQTAKREGIGGLEFLEGIPGTLGGAMRMNAGAMGAWTFHVLDHLRFMDPNGVIHESAGRQVGSEYRSCPLFQTHIALGAVLSGKASPPDQIRETLELYNRKRWESQPPQPSAGCTFKNPAPDLPAGRLIDELGLKQYRSGNAMVSDVHANFIVNLGGATASDVLRVIEEVQSRARRQRGIDLHVEVEILGEE